MPEWGKWIWFNGKLVEWGEAKIHVMTQSLHYGTSVFEGIRAYLLDDGDVGVFRLEEHMKRFIESAKIYGFTVPYSIRELCDAVVETVRANGPSDYYVRPIGFINLQELSLIPSSRELSVAIGVLKWGKFLGKAYEVGAKVTVSGWRRAPQDVMPAPAKAGGHYVLAYMTSLQAKLRGFDEALLLDERGFVVEGSAENVFMIKDGIAYTPPTNSPILIGITRDTIMKLLENELGVKVVERDIALGEFLTADEAFFAGTAAEITPVVEVDGVKIGDGKPGEVTRKLQKLYEDAVRCRIPKYSRWITKVGIKKAG